MQFNDTEDMMSRYIALFPLVMIGFGASVMPAKAHIWCEDEFQIINGQRVATPYCEAELLARASGGRGVMISGDAVRKDPQLREALCRGNDPSPACAPFQD
jgi:hypothetical protein